MEFFRNARIVRLKAHNGKYLVARSDGENVKLDRDGSESKACWGVGFDPANTCIIFRSCYGRNLTASQESDHLRGKKVTQSLSSGNEIYWLPVKYGNMAYFQSYSKGAHLRANGGVPPLRNTVSYAETKTIDEQFQWTVEVLEFSHVQLPRACSSTGNNMEEIRAVAMAYYANCPNDYKANVIKTFQDADSDGNGTLSFSEFKAACDKLNCVVNSDDMFRIIDKDGSGTVCFEEAVTFYYMHMNRKLFCCEGSCKQLLFMSYFSCVKCFCNRKSGSKQFNLCVSCYGEKRYKHEHAHFLDNFTLLNHITPKNDPNAILEAIAAFNTGWSIGTFGTHAVAVASVGCSIM